MSGLSQDLCEQLRLILEPTMATKLKGDYRTGKRLNMKKIIPYIASGFKKDKIWLRRTKPSARQYQVMICIDNSASMADNHSVQLAFESLCLLSKALSQLEVGDIGVVAFGEEPRLLHQFGTAFGDDAGAAVLGAFDFASQRTRVAPMLEQCLGIMHDARATAARSTVVEEPLQLMFILSDGVLLEGDQVRVRQMVRAAAEQRVLISFIIVDDPLKKHSILDVQSFSFVNGVPKVSAYMDSFPFPYYVILRDIQSLPDILADALRQWFELVASKDF